MRRASEVAGAMESILEMFGEGDKGTESQLGGEQSRRTSQGCSRDRLEGPHGQIIPE